MASTEAQLRASEIKNVLLKEIEQYSEELQVEEVGSVLEVKDGVARIYGLSHAMASEMLEITSSDTGESVIVRTSQFRAIWSIQSPELETMVPNQRFRNSG